MASVGLRDERDGPVAVLTLDRPDRLNALSRGLVQALSQVLDQIRDDANCRVVVLTGAGRAFSAGSDLKERGARAKGAGRGSVQADYRLQSLVAGLAWKLRRIPQPVIAAVNGVAAGGGLALALAADIRIGEPGARFNAAFVRIGATGGDMGASYFLPRTVGADRAAELLFTGRFVEADEALAIGLLTRLVRTGESLKAALALAADITANAPFSTRLTKSLLNQAMDGATLEQMLELENRSQILAAQTADFAEGVGAFLEKRTPEYSDT